MPTNTAHHDGEGGSHDPAVKRYRPGDAPAVAETGRAAEVGGRKDGTEPTRFGDWEKKGRCIDF